MFGFGFPTPAYLVTVFIAPLIVACMIVNWRENLYTVVTWWAILITDFLISTCVLPAMFKKWEADNIDEPQARPQPTTRQPLQNLNETGNVYSLNSIKVRFDPRRNFARALLSEWEHHGKINATEAAWIEPRVNSVNGRILPKRWQGTDAAFRNCKSQMEQDGILGRENPANGKSRFIVRDVVKLQEIVEGRR